MQTRLDQFLAGGDVSDAALKQWWKVTEQYLAGYGCAQCAAKMASPNPPVQQRMVSVGCNAGPPDSGDNTQTADDSGTGDDGSWGWDSIKTDLRMMVIPTIRRVRIRMMTSSA